MSGGQVFVKGSPRLREHFSIPGYIRIGDADILYRRLEIFGGAEGDRTPDLRIANATLSQLSYGPVARRADYGDRGRACQAHPGLASRAGRAGLRPACGAGKRTLPSQRASPSRSCGHMYAFLNLVSTVIQIYIWLLIAQAVLSWLVAFGIANRHNRAVSIVGDFLWRITEPLLRPIRRVLPDLGGIDISPVILILLLYFVRNLMFEYLA
jgi:YggT family protein